MSALKALVRQLSELALKLQREMKVASPFHPYIFRRIVTAGIEIARNRNLIQ
jgi:hypothetical protein